LYGQGYTIRGVQRILREQGPRFVQAVWQEGAPQPPVGHGGEEGEAEATSERGLFGLWPAMGAREDPEGAPDEAAEAEPDQAPHVRLAAPPRAAAQPAAPPPPRIAPEDMQRLRATLEALEAARKLLDSALTG
jgi:hypothetical protein